MTCRTGSWRVGVTAADTACLKATTQRSLNVTVTVAVPTPGFSPYRQVGRVQVGRALAVNQSVNVTGSTAWACQSLMRSAMPSSVARNARPRWCCMLCNRGPDGDCATNHLSRSTLMAL